MSLRSLQRNWDRLGARDPFWAILTDPRKRHQRWAPAEFFESGDREVAEVLRHLERIHKLPAKSRALDFGCGVGRLSQPLAEHFEQVAGVDISPAMIQLANRYNRHGERCRYHLNHESDLRLFPDSHFDFIYSSITLQHMEPPLAKLYLADFVRILAPGGVAVFQLPARRAPSAFARLHGLMEKLYVFVFSRFSWERFPVIEMHGIEPAEVQRVVEASGGAVLEMVPDSSSGPTWESYRYTVSRK